MTGAPAWGTPEPVAVATRYTVVGFYAATDQRFCQHTVLTGAPSPEGARAAEDWAQAEYGGQVGDDNVACDLRITGVLAVVDGEIRAFDSYAEYLDPDQVDHWVEEAYR